MARKTYIYLFIAAVVVVQTFFMRGIKTFPDLTLLLVVYMGTFGGRLRGIETGIVAGILRGVFSFSTAVVDSLALACIGFLSSVMVLRFYRHNPVVQIFTSAIAIMALIAAHTLYFKAATDSGISMSSIVLDEWRTILMTSVVSPVVFYLLSLLLPVTEE